MSGGNDERENTGINYLQKWTVLAQFKCNRLAAT
jgi:hypothetical protein